MDNYQKYNDVMNMVQALVLSPRNQQGMDTIAQTAYNIVSEVDRLVNGEKTQEPTDSPIYIKVTDADSSKIVGPFSNTEEIDRWRESNTTPIIWNIVEYEDPNSVLK